MIKSKAINRSIFIITIFVYLIALLIFGYEDYSYNKNQIMENIDKQLFNSAAALKYILPDDLHDRAIDEQAISIKEDIFIASKLTEFIKETGFKYTYTIVKKGDMLFFVVSDLQADPETKRDTFYFYPYEEADESFYKAFEQEKPTFKTVSDQWGTVRTVIVPEKSPGGIKYLACADYDISYVDGVLRNSLLRSIAIVLFFLSLSIPIILIYNKLHREYWDSLRESEERYRLLAENIDDVIWMSDLALNWNYISPSIEKLTGYNSKEAVNIPLQKMLTPVSAENAVNILTEELGNSDGQQQENRSRILQVEFYRKDGSTVWAEANVSFQWDKDGNPKGLLGVVRNIDYRKKTEREKAKLENQLLRARKMEALGALAGGVAHDLNNVLSGIVSYPDLLLMQLPKDSPLLGPILTMQDSGKKAAAIVQDLLTLARSGVVTEEVVKINRTISEYLKSPEYNKLISFHPLVDVETNLESDLFNITGSYLHLFKTVMNLVSNAAEAIPDRGKISISTENRHIDSPLNSLDGIEGGDYVTLIVSDTGIGISLEDRDRIFEPFFTKKTMGRSGTGLGMAVVWGTVKDHKGHIDVQSIEGKGTTFTLYFPATRRLQGKDPSTLPLEKYMGNGESILVVDDSEKQREIASNLLKALGYLIDTVSSGEEAINYIKENTVDLLILDMIMDPGIDGLDTYKKIIKINSKQKAIIASGFSETARVREAQKLGVGQYIKKPYTMEKIGIAVFRELRKLL